MILQMRVFPKFAEIFRDNPQADKDQKWVHEVSQRFTKGQIFISPFVVTRAISKKRGEIATFGGEIWGAATQIILNGLNNNSADI